MSRQVDPNNLTADDVEYIRQRPGLRQEIIAQGFGDPLSENYEGLEDAKFRDPADIADVGALREQVVSLQGELQERDEEIGRLTNRVSELEDAANQQQEKPSGDDNEEPVGLPESKQWDSGMTKSELRAVIDARNSDYEDDEKIEPSEDKKDALVAALTQDDKELAGE